MQVFLAIQTPSMSEFITSTPLEGQSVNKCQSIEPTSIVLPSDLYFGCLMIEF